MTARPPYFNPDGKTVSDAWTAKYGFVVYTDTGEIARFPALKPNSRATYVPTPKGLEFHESVAPNCIIEGSRGTGKSSIIRMDAHMRAMSCPNYTYLIIRRVMPELKRSHLRWIGQEMRLLKGHWHKTDHIATYHNGSQGFFSQCENEDDMLKLLSSQYDAIYFDEITTFTWEMITKIGSCTRVEEGSDKLAIVRGGTNPIGVGAMEVRSHYIAKDVLLELEPDYDPTEYQSIHTTLDDNPHVDREQYIRRLSGLPAHIKRAWLYGEWIIEGAYFHDFWPSKGEQVWHVADEYPIVKPRQGMADYAYRLPWIQVYRALDWGFSPDPAVCLWIASLPNGRAFVLKEQTWYSTTARQVARDIVEASKDLHTVDTYCDPTMFFNEAATEHTSIGDIFEANGIPLSPSVNDRTAAGFAIHEYLSTVLEDGLPKLQIYGPGCPMLTRTLPEMRVHKTDPRKIANGNDHWVIALAYFCMGTVGVSRETLVNPKPRWMRPNPRTHGRGLVMGSESVRRVS